MMLAGTVPARLAAGDPPYWSPVLRDTEVAWCEITQFSKETSQERAEPTAFPVRAEVEGTPRSREHGADASVVPRISVRPPHRKRHVSKCWTSCYSDTC